MFPLILQAHKLFIVTHHTITTPSLVSLNERESQGEQTVCLSVLLNSLARFARYARFTSRISLPFRLNLLNLIDCFTISTIHVLIILSDMLCSKTSKWNHVIEVNSSLDSFFKDVLASKIHHHFQCHEVFNACQQAHINLVKEGVTRFNQDLIESSFKETQK